MKLSDICDVYSGYALKEFNNEGDGFPVIKIGNILSDGSLLLEDCQYSKENINEKYFSKYGDIYVALSGATTGKIGIMQSREKHIINQRVGIVRKKDSDIPESYIKYFLLHQTERILNDASGCAQPNISPKQIALYEVPNFDHEKILNIVSSLDKISNIIELRKQQLQHLDDLIKARFVEMFGDPETNPMGWRCITVQQAINEKIIDKPLDGNHGGKHPKVSDYVSDGIPFIMANNLVDGRVDLKNCAFITRKQADSLDKGFAKDGDVLITHKGTIGRTTILHCEYPYIMLTPQVTYYRPITGIVSEYLKAYFDTDYFKRIIENIASVGSTRAYIGITVQQELPLLIPTIETQQEYATFVEQVDKSKVAVQKALDEAQTLFDSLMQEYFG